MRKQTKHAVRQVLREARRKEDFFDYSDSERAVWLIGRGYELGLRQRLKPRVESPGTTRRRRS